jgi:hypothetical protein
MTSRPPEPLSRIGLGLAALGRPGYINLGHASDLAGHTDESSMELAAHTVAGRRLRGGACATSTPLGPTGRRRRSWLRGSRAAGSGLARSPSARSGAIRTRAAGASRRPCTRSRICRSRRYAASSLRAGSCSGLISACTRSTPPRWCGVLDDPAVLEDLARLRASGVSIGVTVTGPKQPETIERALEVGGFDAVQATWNLLEPRRAPRLPRPMPLESA